MTNRLALAAVLAAACSTSSSPAAAPPRRAPAAAIGPCGDAFTRILRARTADDADAADDAAATTCRDLFPDDACRNAWPADGREAQRRAATLCLRALCKDCAVPDRLGALRDAVATALATALGRIAPAADPLDREQLPHRVLERLIPSLRLHVRHEPGAFRFDGTTYPTGTPPTPTELAPLLDAMRAREHDPGLADIVVETSAYSDLASLAALQRAVEGAGYHGVVACSPEQHGCGP